MTGLQMPSLIICNRNFFSRKKLQDYGLDSNASSYLMLMAGNPIITKRNMSEEDQAVVQRAHSTIHDLLVRHGMTLPELIKALSYTCEELITSCMYNYYYLRNQDCCQHYEPIETRMGLCYMYISHPNFRQTLNGDYMGLSLYMRIPEDDAPELSRHILDMTQTMKDGLQVTVTNNVTYPSFAVASESTTLTPHTLTSIALQLTEVRGHGES
ncbi:uncharacterized protein LOC122259236 [Penaeus japonicus]|uniref:uncharacterized protein LOC122259236 n=1 Tax=Penaeus japonicus TaxID=27405 RepID=UPI001C714351|nr:uncharacterized protein LOC122259236 [Penaeus japonicus]